MERSYPWGEPSYDGYDDYDPVESVLGEFVWDCGNADCFMNFQPHYRSECYTPDEYEDYVGECSTHTSQGNDT